MIFDGRAWSAKKEEIIKRQVSQKEGRAPCLAVVLVGSHQPSEIYVKRKKEACERVGVRSIIKQFPDSIKESELLNEIIALNRDKEVDGILVQLPLPKGISPFRVMETIAPFKDVDGFHPLNIGKLLIGQKGGFVPCTPLGIYNLLTTSDVELDGKHLVVIGRSNIVGKPLAALFAQFDLPFNIAVTLIDRDTPNIKNYTQNADIIAIAVGVPGLLDEDMVKEGAVVIDIGINRTENGNIVGDANFDALKEKCSLITPVPGGVGPLTIIALLENTLRAHARS